MRGGFFVSEMSFSGLRYCAEFFGGAEVAAGRLVLGLIFASVLTARGVVARAMRPSWRKGVYLAAAGGACARLADQAKRIKRKRCRLWLPASAERRGVSFPLLPQAERATRPVRAQAGLRTPWTLRAPRYGAHAPAFVRLAVWRDARVGRRCEAP